MKLLVWYALLLGLGASSLSAQAGKPAKLLFLVGGLYHDYDQLPRHIYVTTYDNMLYSVGLGMTEQ